MGDYVMCSPLKLLGQAIVMRNRITWLACYGESSYSYERLYWLAQRMQARIDRRAGKHWRAMGWGG